MKEEAEWQIKEAEKFIEEIEEGLKELKNVGRNLCRT